MTSVSRSLLLCLSVLPLGCPLLQEDDFVLVTTPSSGAGAGGAPAEASPDLAGSPAAGASACGGENWSERGTMPHMCDSKPPK